MNKHETDILFDHTKGLSWGRLSLGKPEKYGGQKFEGPSTPPKFSRRIQRRHSS